jgi:L-fuculose-phosphate aldolase
MGELYVGVKFKTVHEAPETVNDPRIAELIRVGKLLADKGFCPENSGNMSFRAAKGFVITAAGSKLGELTSNDFVLVKKVDLARKAVFCAGKVQPSSEAMMHQMIYDARHDIDVILHAHALDLKGAAVTEKEYPYGTFEFARSAAQALEKHDLVILKGHGFVSVGKTVPEAYEKLALS